jgi:hypothetical protein
MFKATPEVVVFPTSTPLVAEVVCLAHHAQILLSPAAEGPAWWRRPVVKAV